MATGIGLTAYGTRTEAIPTASLNSIANNANAIGTTAINNSSVLRNRYIQFDFALASIDLSTQTSPAVYIWLLENTTGSTYEDGSGSVSPARNPDLIIPLRSVNGAQVVQGACNIKPGISMVLIGNRSGVTFASSGNALYYKLFSDEINN